MNFHDTQFLSKLAADTIVVIHFAFVLFALLGGLTRAFSAGVELAGADAADARCGQ